VDVVVPFRGTPEALDQLTHTLSLLRLSPGDTLLVVDNTPHRASVRPPSPAGVPILAASERLTPGYARNRGAERGRAEWLVFLDADVEPPPDLLERYFDPAPAATTVLLAGGIRDEAAPPDAPGPARYAYLRETLSQDRTLAREERFAFAQSANVACRRDAFDAIGGFREDIRAGEDADLSYRLKAAEGKIERREHASVIHRNRATLRAFLAQAARHGAGSAWVERRYPGAFPSRRRPGLIWWALRTMALGFSRGALSGERDRRVVAIYEPLWELAFEFGRSRSAQVPPITSDSP
jgi:GT2 family glycosyltransferase